jgi:hypothetical protein
VSEARKKWNEFNKVCQVEAEEKLFNGYKDKIQSPNLAWKVLEYLRHGVKGVPIPPHEIQAHFEEVYNVPGLNNFPTLSPVGQNIISNDVIDKPFVSLELDSAFDELNLMAATGPDLISANLFLKLFNSTQCKEVLLTLFNQCLNHGTIPLSWGESEI